MHSAVGIGELSYGESISTKLTSPVRTRICTQKGHLIPVKYVQESAQRTTRLMAAISNRVSCFIVMYDVRPEDVQFFALVKYCNPAIAENVYSVAASAYEAR